MKRSDVLFMMATWTAFLFALYGTITADSIAAAASLSSCATFMLIFSIDIFCKHTY